MTMTKCSFIELKIDQSEVGRCRKLGLWILEGKLGWSGKWVGKRGVYGVSQVTLVKIGFFSFCAKRKRYKATHEAVPRVSARVEAEEQSVAMQSISSPFIYCDRFAFISIHSNNNPLH
ncbi:hypothetical protein QVD17_04791 [Tagetes erecta]|uniref:Uncharacterized protein n=1 Tax=Tagetes erecta TaxID=13708 RepID=A0AAD8PB07_TARER|nr:hypothetical protein QVD17_04791 [Tagetes erecta]